MARDPDTRRRMTALVRAWEASDQTRAAFARAHGLTLSTFEYWKRRVRREVRPQPAVQFRPVQVLTDAAAPAVVEMILPTGERLIIREDVSATLLRTILGAIRSC